MSKDISTEEHLISSTDMEESSSVVLSASAFDGIPGYPQWRLDELRVKYSERFSNSEWQDCQADQFCIPRRGDL